MRWQEESGVSHKPAASLLSAEKQLLIPGQRRRRRQCGVRCWGNVRQNGLQGSGLLAVRLQCCSGEGGINGRFSGGSRRERAGVPGRQGRTISDTARPSIFPFRVRVSSGWRRAGVDESLVVSGVLGGLPLVGARSSWFGERGGREALGARRGGGAGRWWTARGLWS